MAKFEICFHGLVCFYAPEPCGGDPKAPKTMALFIRDGHHKRGLVTLDGDTRFPDFNTGSMTVTGGTPGVIESSNDQFQRMVPHLGEDDIFRGGMFVDPSLAIRLVLPPVTGELVRRAVPQPGRLSAKSAQQRASRGSRFSGSSLRPPSWEACRRPAAFAAIIMRAETNSRFRSPRAPDIPYFIQASSRSRSNRLAKVARSKLRRPHVNCPSAPTSLRRLNVRIRTGRKN